MARGLYFLVTPVSPSVLRHVNCLLLGEITLPKIMLTKQVCKSAIYTSIQKLGVGHFIFKKGLCAHQDYIYLINHSLRKSNIVKWYYNFKLLFSILKCSLFL